MDGRMFEGVVAGILFIGALIGVALCGLAWLVWKLFQHIHISWM